jgi:alpha-galactosidase
VGYTTNGSEGVSSRLGAYVRNEILPAEHRHDMRPVLFNSWYATTDKLNEDQQIDLAKIAAGLGVELFVIDAGWYKVNNKWWAGIGNWDVDTVKFPNGLTSLIKKVNDLGMKFGIWVEPENIHVSSDAYLQHPDWALKYPHWDPTHGRPTLNLAKEEVYNHLLETLTKLLTENNIDFVKWDQNNFLGSPSWVNAPADTQREWRIRYIHNLYRLVDELKKRFPKVMFESCSSGGGRIDLGMMSRMDQVWVSDNTTSVDRLFIQYGYLSAMPANTMVSWVIESQTFPTSLNYKFDVAMSGVLGVGYDIRKWTANDLEIAKNKIKLYKEIRQLIQQGVVHRLVSPFENNRCALQYNSSDGKSAVLLCYNLALSLPGSQIINRGSNVIKLKGLNSERRYLIKRANDEKDKGMIYQGDFLMNIGISWPIKEIFESQIMVINQVE